jgi:prepilin-type processing-associated H-X9-DG protein
MSGYVFSALYNHVMPPGSPSCLNGDRVVEGAATVGSRHPNTVNVVFGDGRVAAVTTNISVSVWRAMGSRAGGEPIPSSDLP